MNQQQHHQPQGPPHRQPHQLSVSLSLMGEQTQPQFPIQTQTQTLTQIQTPPQPDDRQLHHDTTIQAADASNAAFPQNSSSSSKITPRPRKIRKVSADISSDNPDYAVLQAGDGDNKALIPTTTNAAASRNNKNNKSNKITATSNNSKSNQMHVQPIRVLPRIVGRGLSCEGEVDVALRHLRASDPQLAQLIDVHQPPTFDTFHPPFLALTKSILYQQLAYKAGTSIYTRFVSLCGGEAGVVPDAVLALSPQQLRQIGVSARKSSYLHDLANKYRNGILSDASIVDMDDKSLFSMLTMVKGIGSWSVHMFMIFSLHRPDVLPIGDVSIRKGVQLLHGLEELPRPSQMDHLCEKWRPYRSVASWYLWRFVEAKGASASAAAVAVGASQPPQLQQQQQQLQLQDQQQLHLLDSINGIASFGACAWGP